MSKPPSWNEIRGRAAEFASRWADETDENAGAQTFWNEFLGMFGIDRKRVAVFEKRAERASTGGRGRIDLFWPGVLAVEHKSAGKDLIAAERQCLDYLEGLDPKDLPSAIITSDFSRIRFLDLAGDGQSHEFSTKDLPREIDRFGFIAGYATRNLGLAEKEVDAHAAELMGQLYEEIADIGFTDHEVSVFLTRMLFLFFGDDTGLWERNLFLEFLETRTHQDGSDLGPQIALLFQTLDRPIDRRPPTLDETLQRFPYVNGGLFQDRLDIPAFDATIRRQMIECCLLDWGAIIPAIFGSMFQAVKSKEARRALGEHYTSEENILKVIGPLLLDDLRAQFETAFNDVKRLHKLRDSLANFKFLDPACGCGNFLAITYREMRALELAIMKRLRDLTGESQLSLDPTLGLRISPSQFHGIEVEEWPARIAEVALFLVDHQANLRLAEEFGQAPDRLPIAATANIVQGDALKLNWAEVVDGITPYTLILGNPPFAGRKTRSKEQTAELMRVFGDAKGSGNVDYVCAWFAVASQHLEGTKARAAFVATNSVAQGEQPAVLWGLLTPRNVGIDFAWRTFQWQNAAPGQAAVHCVIVGFSDQSLRQDSFKWLYPSPPAVPVPTSCSSINRYLVDGPDVDIRSRREGMVPNYPAMRYGSMPHDGGHLLLSGDEARDILERHVDAQPFIRRLIGAAELLRGTERFCIWVPDDRTIDAANIPAFRDRAIDVRAERLASPDPAAVQAADRPLTFKARRQPTTDYIAVPLHSSEQRAIVPMAIFPPDVIATNAVATIAPADPFVFGVLQSSAFSEWNAAVSGRIKSDLRISADITYNNFPWPPATDGQKIEIAEAAKEVLGVREEFQGRSLADLYDPFATPPALVAAHRHLNALVSEAYGLPRRASAETLLAALFALFNDLSVADQLDLEKGRIRKRAVKAL